MRNVRCRVNALRAFVIYLFFASAQAADVTGFYDFIGAPLSESEKAAVIAGQSGIPVVRIPLLIRKDDIDIDGEPDIVVLSTISIAVFFKRGATFQKHGTGIRRGIPLSELEKSELSVVSGLKGRREILVKARDVCYVAYISTERLKASGTLLEYERFTCQDSLSHEWYFQARGECLAAGGTWGPQGMLRNGACVRTLGDTGKPCSGPSECQGKCLYGGPRVPLGTEVTGACSHSNRSFGCFEMVRDGKYAGSLCVD